MAGWAAPWENWNWNAEAAEAAPEKADEQAEAAEWAEDEQV